MRNDPEMIQLLIRRYAPIDRRDSRGRTPLSYTLKNIKELFEILSNSFNGDIDFIGPSGNNLKSRKEIKDELEKSYDIMSVTLNFIQC